MRKSYELYSIIKNTKKNDLIKAARKLCPHGHSLLAHPNCFKKALGLEERIGILDIETTGLKANYGFMISYCIKHYKGGVIKNCVTPREVRTGVFEKRLMKDFVKDCEKFDRFITFYGTLFDLPYLRTKALYYDLDFPRFQEIKHTDVFFMAKSKLKLNSHSLKTICSYFNITAKQFPVTPKVWNQAGAGSQKAFDYIIKHNIEDVVSTEKVFDLLKKFVGPRNNSI